MKQSPGSSDCVAVVAAMITKTKVQEFRDYIGRSDGPYYDHELAAYLLKHSWMMGAFFENGETKHKIKPKNLLCIEFRLEDLPAYIAVTSKSLPGETHAIYWDGKQVWDPYFKTPDGKPISSYDVQAIWPLLKVEKDMEEEMV